MIILTKKTTFYKNFDLEQFILENFMIFRIRFIENNI